MNWYYAVDQQRLGPVSEQELARLAATGTIVADTLVWREGMSNWQRYAEVVPAPAASPVTAGAGDDTEICAVSGKRYPKREMVQYEGKWISAEHRDEFFQRLREGVALPGENIVPGRFGYSGFWRRVLARIIDGLITGLVGGFIGGIVGGILGASGAMRTMSPFLFQAIIQPIGIGIGLSYEIIFVRKFDATPGKMALGIKLLRPDGSKLSVGRIVGRYFANYLNVFTLLIGYIILVFDDERRALHDRICDTRVIKSRD